MAFPPTSPINGRVKTPRMRVPGPRALVGAGGGVPPERGLAAHIRDGAIHHGARPDAPPAPRAVSQLQGEL